MHNWATKTNVQKNNNIRFYHFRVLIEAQKLNHFFPSQQEEALAELQIFFFSPTSNNNDNII